MTVPGPDVVSPWFWTVVESSRSPATDSEAHADAITELLASAGVEETLAFARDFDRAVEALNTWDLWGAAYLALGGCSDDAFEYLRAWLVGQGEVVWTMARDDPQALFIRLLDGAEDPESRWDQLGMERGEVLIYAAGRAHETLTGQWLPPRADESSRLPAGQDWDEADLPSRFPDLASALPGWWQGGAMAVDLLAVFHRASGGVDFFSQGDHARSEALLDPIVSNSSQWAMISNLPDLRIGVAYALGMIRMLRGDVDGAAEVLHRVEGDIGGADHLRRGLSQVELARGRLDAAARLLDPTPDADRFDRVLSAKLAWRRGDRVAAIERARAELNVPMRPGDHPWDVAGGLQQAGRVLVDAGETVLAAAAMSQMRGLLRGAPETLPLMTHLALLEAALGRAEGRPEAALERLRRLEGLEGSDLAEWHRECARALAALGRDDEAAAEYDSAVESFTAAGERWEAQATREESAG